ncbi:MAG: hypothetical protein JSU65_13140 [Candidatus Zixiibacteriota bacterium]|nr:MAG: hypothetical protein JSU65_13140 [candidate division Zixibacteria bacterium]
MDESTIGEVTDQLAAAHGESERARISKGVLQVAQLWQSKDGDGEQFARFCKDNYIADPETRQMTADRLEEALANIYGHFREMGKRLSWHTDVVTGPVLPIDYTLAAFSPGSHLSEDFFASKIAFIVLLNYPLHTLQEYLEQGPTWTRAQWAQARLAGNFDTRIPSEVSQQITNAYVDASTYIDKYNIFMHHLLDESGERLFPEGMRLVTHWNLRDELKAQYSNPDGLTRQEMIYDVMLRIIRQEVPQTVINNPAVDWKPATNEVTMSSVIDGDVPEDWSHGEAGTPVDNTPEPDARYDKMLGHFRARLAADPYYPNAPTHMLRRFERGREIPEAEVKAIFESICASPIIGRIGKLIEKRLGRELRPFDIWYDGFKPRGSIAQETLDSIVRAKYPSVEAFENDLPNILGQLGFSRETAEFLCDHIGVDPSRGIGHASGPGLRTSTARLRTRVPESGMDYKGYNIAIHEFGHNVEQVLSLCKIDHTLLRGVPNTAFTEGFAFVFQSRDLELLGIDDDDPTREHLKVLDNLWGTCEIAAVSLVDMAAWNWMYENPDATPAELKQAITGIARDIWNRYYAPVMDISDVEILAIYSHMIESALYLPDYPLGHIISFQVEEHMKKGDLAEEMERMCTSGSVTPDLWMQNAVGSPISAAPLLQAAERALESLE